jgi:hypothetical protein
MGGMYWGLAEMPARPNQRSVHLSLGSGSPAFARTLVAPGRTR